jgi:RNA polymerase sigma factor (sigma-70 family)
LPSTKSIYDEPALVNGLKQQDKAAFEYLYNQYSATLLGVIMRSIQDEAIANDLLQDVFVKIWKNIGGYDASKGRLYTWMLNIARNTGIDYLRSKQNKQESQNQNLENVVNTIDKSHQVTQSIENIGLKSILEQLSPEQQLLIDYVYFKGYTQDDASKVLNLPLGTVKTRLRAAIGQLRKQFTKE